MERAFLENIKVGDQALPAPIIDAIMQEHSRGIDNATRAETVDNGSKTFTQEDVNRIVSERLERERAKGKPTPEDERETALKAKEAAMDCREYIKEHNYPEKLLDIIDTSDFSEFQNKVFQIMQVAHELKSLIPPPYAAKTGTQPFTRDDPIANAFKPNY